MNTLADIIKQKKTRETIIKNGFDKIAENNEIIAGKTKRDIDILKAYEMLKNDQQELIKLKLASQCLNLGIALKDLPKDNISFVIYHLSALNERKNFLTNKRLHRRHGKLSNGTGGYTTYESIMNEYWIRKEVEALDAEIAKCESKLTELNSKVQDDLSLLDLPF